MSTLLPLYDKVIVRPSEPEHTGLLQVVRLKEEFPEQGEIVAVAKNIDDVKEGDTVLFRKGAGTMIRHDGEELLAVPSKELLAAVEP